MKRKEATLKKQKLARGMRKLREDERREREFTKGVPTHPCFWAPCPHPAPGGSPWCYRHSKVMRDYEPSEILLLPPDEMYAKLAEVSQKMAEVR